MAENTVAMNPVKLLDTTRYNGGWIKSVTGLDKSRANGYSILGEFMRNGVDIYQIGGLYLDCSIGGSRRKPEKFYTLFRVVSADEVEVLARSSGRDWAVALWPAIEAALAEPGEDNPLAAFTTDELLAELKRRGVDVIGTQ